MAMMSTRRGLAGWLAGFWVMEEKMKK